MPLQIPISLGRELGASEQVRLVVLYVDGVIVSCDCVIDVNKYACEALNDRGDTTNSFNCVVDIATEQHLHSGGHNQSRRK